MRHHDCHPVFFESIGLAGCVPKSIWGLKKRKIKTLCLNKNIDNNCGGF